MKKTAKSYSANDFERPSVTVDVVLLSVNDGKLHTLLVQRSEAPEKGRWALPGGFVRIKESLEDAAARLLADKAGLGDVFIEQLFTFGDLGRDPRTRVITVAYYALVECERLRALAGREPAAVFPLSVPWEGETGGPVDALGSDGKPLRLAFDHANILGTACKRIRGRLTYSPIGFQLLPSTFTLWALQQVHETILDRPLNKDSFRRRMLASGDLEATGQSERAVDHRPAELYRFSKRSAV